MADREPFRLRVDVRPRFRCLFCRRFVLGTDHGTCPQCGWRPPRLLATRPAPRVGRAVGLVVLAIVLTGVAAALR